MGNTVVILMALLAVGFLSIRLAARLKIPHSVFLVVLGVAAGVWLRNRVPGAWEEVRDLQHLFPDLVLFVLLPPVVFESAYYLDLADLKRDIIPLSTLAVVALVLSAALIGYGLYWAFGLPLLPCLTFGALISATDPVAVVALFKEIGAPKRLHVLVEGESLLNDGTAMALFRTLLAVTIVHGAYSGSLIGKGVLQFLWVSIGGVVVGAIFGALTSFLLRINARYREAQLGISVAAAYLSFAVADLYLGLSGVICTLTVGVYLGHRSRFDLSQQAREGMAHLWGVLARAANIFVFFAVGLSVAPQLLLGSFRYIPITLAIAYGARAVSIFSTIPLVSRLERVPPIPLSYQVALFWGGLRGGLALGLVLMLPMEFPERDLFIALAIAVVMTTLFLNALTARKVLSMLRLGK